MSEKNETDTLSSDNGEKTFRELMEQSNSVPAAPAADGGRRTPPPPFKRHSQPKTVGAAPATIEETEDEYMAPGLQHREMHRLKQGKFRIGDNNKIDLHGLTRDEAYQAFHEFLDHCMLNGIHHIIVICGKGIHSPTGKPVLKSAIRGWLVEHGKVLAYCPAQMKNGGSGALYVLLKTRRSSY